MSTKYKKLTDSALLKNAQWELKQALPMRFREKRVTEQVRIEKGRLERIRRHAGASQVTLSKTLDWLIDKVLPPESDGIKR
jgi:hypothetical protein